MSVIAGHTLACLHLELKTLPRFFPVNLSLSIRLTLKCVRAKFFNYKLALFNDKQGSKCVHEMIHSKVAVVNSIKLFSSLTSKEAK